MKKTTKIFRATALLVLTAMLSIGFIGCKGNGKSPEDSGTGGNGSSTTNLTVTFDANTGKFADGTTKTVQVEKGKTVAKVSENPTKAGFVFTGWFTKAQNGEKYDFTKAVTKSFTLYAKWEKQEADKRLVTFDLQGGKFTDSSTSKTEKVKKGEKLKEPSEKPAKTGFIFIGWFTKDTNGEKYDFTKAVTKSFTLYAQWKEEHANEWLVSFDSCGGSKVAEPNVYVPKGTVIGRPITDPTKTGYSFKHWSTEKAGDEYKFIYAVTNNMTLYAVWEANTYTIKFEGNGASGTMTEQVLTYDKKEKLKANTCVKTGYTFTGWKDLENVKTYTAEQEIENLTSENGKVFTFTAQWEANSYTIKFDGNGAESGEMTAQTFTYDKAENLKANAFKKTGYKFTGWKDEKGTIYSDKKEIKNLTSENGKVFTFTAQWKQIHIEIIRIKTPQEAMYGDSGYYLPFNNEIQFTAEIEPETALIQTVNWSSSDTDIAEFDQNGKLSTKNKSGTIEITAEADGKEYTRKFIVGCIPVKYSELEDWLSNTASSSEINYIKITEIPKEALEGPWSGYSYDWSELDKKICNSDKKVFLQLELKNNEELKEIPNSAFIGCTNLVGINLPTSLTSIGWKAFEGCKNLVNINISDCTSLSKIGKEAFYGCSSLTSIDLPASLSSIRDAAFGACMSLTSITVADDNTNYLSEDGVLFDKNKKYLICYPACKSETSFTVPASVKNIESYAFWNSTNLTSIDLSNCTDLCWIKNYAFSECTNLTSIDLSNCTDLRWIENYAFSECTNLTSVDLSKCTSLKKIEMAAFWSCTNAVIKLPNQELKNIQLGRQVFDKCKEVHCHSTLEDKIRRSKSNTKIIIYE